jgi:PhnB protein
MAGADPARESTPALASSATILIQLAPAPFAPLYGMLTDRYGVTWIVGADTAPLAD